jgi:hypothetical protein
MSLRVSMFSLQDRVGKPAGRRAIGSEWLLTRIFVGLVANTLQLKPELRYCDDIGPNQSCF